MMQDVMPLILMMVVYVFIGITLNWWKFQNQDGNNLIITKTMTWQINL